MKLSKKSPIEQKKTLISHHKEHIFTVLEPKKQHALLYSSAMNTHSMKVCRHSESHTNLKGLLVISGPSPSSADHVLRHGLCLF